VSSCIEYSQSLIQICKFSIFISAATHGEASSSSIAKVNSNTDAPPSTVETQEVDLTSHDPQNPPSPPHASTSSSSVVQSVVSQGGSSESSNDAATTTNVTDDDQFQGMSSSSSSVQTVSVLREGIEDIIIKAAELIVEASIMSCAQYLGCWIFCIGLYIAC
jgi:hypothetical protein